jgi:hypothetical protein
LTGNSSWCAASSATQRNRIGVFAHCAGWRRRGNRQAPYITSGPTARAIADGVSAIYTGLESVLDAIGNEIDEYTPRGDASHADLVDGMALALNGVRPAVLSEATRELMHGARKFRHVVRHKYALELKQTDVAKNFRLAKKLVPAFEKDYRRFVRLMLEERPVTQRRTRR